MKRIFSCMVLIGFALLQAGWVNLPLQSQNFRVCFYENAPKIYTDENGKAAGFWVELLEHIADQEGWQITWIHGEWEDCLQWLNDHEIDILPDTGWTEPRSQVYAFNEETVLVSWTRLYARPGLKIESILDLEGKSIAGLAGSFNLDGPEGLRDILDRFDVQASVIEMEGYTQIFEAVARGEVDAGITNRDFGNLNESNYDVDRTPIIFQPARIQFAFTKAAPLTPYLIERIDARLKELKADSNSVYYHALEQHLGEIASGAVKRIIPGWVVQMALLAGGVILFLLAVGVTSQIQVRQRTAELRKSHAVLQAIMDGTTDMIFAKDTQGRYTLFNAGAEKAVGKSAGDLLGRDDRFLYPAEAERIIAQDREIIAGGKVITYEETVLNAENRTQTYLTAKGPIFDRDENPLGLFGIARNITERKRAEEEIRHSRHRLAELSRRLVEAHETESRAIGRELHDQIGQMLTALKLTLDLASQLPPEQAAQKLARAQELVEDLMSRVSSLSLELRPPMLDDLGLIPALTWRVQRYQENTQIEVDFKHRGVEGIRYDREIETAAYRIIQEALTNAARHAGGTHVRLAVRADVDRLDIEIEDNGIGFDPQAALEKHHGLSAMRERAHLLGGSFQIESQPGTGTKILIQLILRKVTQ